LSKLWLIVLELAAKLRIGQNPRGFDGRGLGDFLKILRKKGEGT